MREPQTPIGPRRHRRWPSVSWWFSLLLVVPLLLAAATVLYQTVLVDHQVTGVVLDAYTGSPVASATVEAGSRQLSSDADGRFRVEKGLPGVTVSKPGYQAAEAPLVAGPLQIRLRPNVVEGTVTNQATQQPVKGVTVRLTGSGATVGETTTGADGRYALDDVPPGASLAVDSADFAPWSSEIDQRTRIDVALRPDVLTGRITDEKGAPVAGATVVVGQQRVVSGTGGTYRLEGAPASGEVVIKSPGYQVATASLNPALKLDARLSSLHVNALYAGAGTAGDAAKLDELIQVIDTTEANALVVDLKDSSGTVYYDTQVPLAREIGAVDPAFDPRQVVAKLHQHHIYAIARIVVFEDPILAEKRPELAIHDSATGDLWRTWNGLAWVNAHKTDVWDYNIALAREAAAFGFDEIQFDYIRFPSDGPLDRADYGVPQTAQTREQAITGFLQRAYDAIAPTKAYLAADVFGLTMWATDDSDIGQNLEAVAPYLDYICPMVYPSHFYAGSMGFDIPNDHPYEVVLWSLQAGEKRVPEDKNKLRPWLQDFSLGEGISYGPGEVRKQIDAANDFGATGWMLWNAANVYHDTALKPQA
ncbi:MAG TPA: putative glycoside hydrolase [Thermomicrobiaceae bacterium]|nr:putative glycoside hydrolase [Thermomicrobiaceae bacterium]